jgi:FixJ family two-component response regulator
MSTNVTIHIVDDDESVREATKALVRCLGFRRVLTYASGEELLERVSIKEPGCIILDLHLAGIGGLEVQDRLSKLGSNSPIIFVTAYYETKAKARALIAGAIDFLRKPVSDEELITSLDIGLARITTMQYRDTTIPTIYIVDDDQNLREALDALFRSVGCQVSTFGSGQDFLATLQKKASSGRTCLILDVRMPGMSGFDVQEHLAKLGIVLPIIFMSGYGDIPQAVRAIKAGAIDFLGKPFRDQDLLDLVEFALSGKWRRTDSDP